MALEEVMQNLRAVLDARVFVSLGRGLWDCTAREVFDYTEELQEDHHKVGPISCLCWIGHLQSGNIYMLPVCVD